MKLNIAICDDNINHLSVIEGYLEKFNSDTDIHIIKAHSGEELLDIVSDYSIDIAFLDIEMKELNGIEVGREIRTKFPESIIVFITGYRDYALEAFEIESFQYIIKPITCEKFYSVMEKIMLRLREKITYKKKIAFLH